MKFVDYHKQFLILGFIIMILGDLLYFGVYLFPEFMLSLFATLSSTLTIGDMTGHLKTVSLFYLATLGTLMYLVSFLLLAFVPRDGKKQRYIILAGISVWFLTDSIASYIFSFELNILSNVLFLLIGFIFVYLPIFTKVERSEKQPSLMS